MGAIIFGAIALAGGGGGAKRIDITQYLAKLRASHVGGQPVPHTPEGVMIYTFGDGMVAGSPTAADAMIQAIQAGYVIWADITILGRTYYLAFAPSGKTPSGPAQHGWAILADRSSLPLLMSGAPTNVPIGPTPGAPSQPSPFETSNDTPYRPSPASIPIPVPIPVSNVPESAYPPIVIPSTFPGLDPTGPVVLPGAPSMSPSDGKPVTGIADLDTIIRSGDATPAQLHAAAEALRAAGKKELADTVDAYANKLYAELRASHALVGGTPFKIREGDIPWNVAQYYGGTLDQLNRANKPKLDIYKGNEAANGWRVGKIALLPLSWNAESKPVPPVTTRSKTPAPTPYVPSDDRPTTIHEANR